jgi:hypothetical protein
MELDIVNIISCHSLMGGEKSDFDDDEAAYAASSSSKSPLPRKMGKWAAVQNTAPPILPFFGIYNEEMIAGL